MQKKRVYQRLYRKGLPTKNYHEWYCLGFAEEVQFLFAQQNVDWGLVPVVSNEVIDLADKSATGPGVEETVFDAKNESSHQMGVADGKNYNKGIYNTGIE